MMKLVDKITENTQPQLQSAVHVQESAKPRFVFCQWMGVELSFLDANLWSRFQREAFDLVTRYCHLQQTQQPVPPPMAVQLPPMPPQQQIQHQPCAISAPPQGLPPFHLTPPAAWRVPPPGMAELLPAVLNTNGLSAFLLLLNMCYSLICSLVQTQFINLKH